MKSKKGQKLAEWHKKAKEAGVKCEKCGETRHITVDHIIPSSLLFAMTLSHDLSVDWEDNFRFLCRYCNSEKHSQLDMREPKTYKLMREVLDNAEKYFLSKND